MVRPGRWLGSLGWRLLGTFVAVAVGAVALLALVAGVSVDRGTTRLLDQQRDQLRSQLAAALAAAYNSGRGSWDPASLTGVQSLATASDTQVAVTDRSGHQVAMIRPSHDQHWQTTPRPSATPLPSTSSPSSGSSGGDCPEGCGMGGSMGASGWHDRSGALNTADRQRLGLVALNGAAATPSPTAPTQLPAGEADTGGTGTAATTVEVVPIVVSGQQVGTARLTLPDPATSAVAEARSALLRDVGVGTVLAGLLAVAAAVVVSRRLSLPLVALAGAARAVAAGERAPGRLLRPAPGELGEVGRAFTSMAASLRQEEELRRAVVADVAHELRTPVTILCGQTEQLLDGTADPTPERLVSLHDEVLRLERLTEDLATLSAADAAGLALHTMPVDLGGLVDAAVTAMAARLDDADLTVQRDVGAGLLVQADPTRLTQVVSNLLSNAAKFTPAGGTIEVTVRPDGRERAELTITDTGPGIPAAELPHVFERFWRGRTAGSRSGSGIGLAVVHSLVAAHGGTVRLDSPTSGGTRATIGLPLLGRPAAPARAEPGRPALAPPPPPAVS